MRNKLRETRRGKWVGLIALLGSALLAVGIESDRIHAADSGRPDFEFGNYETYEDVGTLTVRIRRYGGSDGPLEATCRAQTATEGDGKATAGVDFGTEATLLFWGNGDTGLKECHIRIIDDGVAEGIGEHLLLVLEWPDAQSPDNTTLAILDDDSAGFAQFSSGVGGGEGGTGLWIKRTGGSAGEVSVSWETYRISKPPAGFASARPNEDYVHTTGTVTWADKDFMEKMISIAVVQDCQPEETELFAVRLTTTTGGLHVGTPATAEIMIFDDDQDGPSPGCTAAPPPNPTPSPQPTSPQPTPSTIPATPTPTAIESAEGVSPPDQTPTATPTSSGVTGMKIRARSPLLARD